ncbi:FecR family protein [Maritimibacter alkaliphilus HTCC2654]|uniref:Putative RTX toxin n=1 Tax=Maritimibacter alkaliphilus HTCC2654 TaxID=314271 RepID=A3VL73_9RHOB|nr:Ig-like domain-containing protein [Maritimibacter alkaliphilus]EAQ10992.1 putative RTX toxin [Rhodobacterales bacterium HTCC2654] [Maritimibacter alkaliphilus HTCC2654]TYP82322.1 FecR family protein [Maritimibacter alkaliphilus HTCC2654]
MRQLDFSTGSGAAPSAVQHVTSADPVVVDDRPIFTADFSREGYDLVLASPGQPDLRLVDYFLQETPLDLVTGNGAVLRGDLAARLAGPIMPGQYAQVGGAASTDPIGQVEALDGVAFAERADGTRVQLDVGSKIYQNDVLITEGGKLSVTFADGTIFTLAADSRMVIDSLVYDAESQDGNSGAFSLIEGGFVFIAGEVAKTGGMDVTTPTATMGIRGTTVLVEITTLDGISTVEVSLNTDPDGGQGAFELRDLDGNLIATIDSTDTKWIVSPVEGETREVVRTAEDLADDQTLLLDAARAYALAFERVDAGGTFVELVSNAGSGSNGPNIGDDTGTQGNQSDPDNTPPPPPGTSGGTTGGAPSPPPPTTQTGGDEAPQNTAPEARNDARSTVEDGPVTGNVLANDSDTDDDDLSVIINTRPKHGTLTIGQDGSYSYTPEPDFNGTDSFTYTVSDGNGGTDSGTVTFTVTSAQDAPVAADDALTLAEDAGPVTVNVLANDSDADGDTLSVIDWSVLDVEGPWTAGEDGDISFAPPADFNGSETIEYTVSDGHGNTDTATLTVTVTPVGDAPVAEDQASETAEDTPVQILPAFATADADGDPVSIIAFTQGSFGTVVDDGEGGFLYTPAENAHGTDSFTYTVSDGTGATDIATVSVTVTPVNDNPVATPESLTVAEDGSGVVYPAFDGTDVDGDPVSISGFTQGAHGSVDTDEEGGLVYTPDADFNGSDSFTYTVSDGQGGTDTQTVTVTVTPVNDDPIATPESLTVAEDGSGVVYPAFAGTDVDGDPVSISGFTQGTHGSVDTDEEGGLVFTPEADFNGTDSFTYTVSDGQGGTDTQTVSVTVTPVEDGPEAVDAAVSTDEDVGVTVYPSFAGTDPDGDEVFISAYSQGAHGSVAPDLEGGLTYTPDPDYNGNDTFTYTVSDGNGNTDTAEVTVTVDAVNDAPKAQDSVLEVDVDTATAGAVVATDTEGDTLTYTLAEAPDHGTVELDGEGGYIYTPDEGYTGFDQFVMQVSDGNGGSDLATVTLEVAQENFPVSGGQSVSLALSEEPVGDAPAGNLRIGVSEVQSNTINLSFALDASGSVGSTGWNHMRAAVGNALSALSDQFAGSETTVNVQFIRYASDVSYNQTFDLVEDKVALIDAITTLGFTGGGTQWDDALDAAKGFFDASESDAANATNILYFVTDGQPTSNSPWETSLQNIENAPYDVDIQAFGIGSGYNTTQLARVDSDDEPTAVSEPGALLAAIQQSPLFAAKLVGLSISLVADGVEHLGIADETSPALTSDGLNFDLPLAEIAGIGVLLGEENLFSAFATFDLDGDLGTTDDQVTINSFERIAKKDAAQTLTGTDKSDLLLGSDEDDVLSGGAGDDILIGFGGTDVFDGGAGRDLLELATGAASDLIETLSGSDIEAISLSNGLADTLFLDVTDVINLSSTADTDLELLLNAALGESATILGETGDVITLLPDGPGAWQAVQSGVADGQGNTLDIYQFVEGGVVMATLGIDDDVTVNIPLPA